MVEKYEYNSYIIENDNVLIRVVNGEITIIDLIFEWQKFIDSKEWFSYNAVVTDLNNATIHFSKDDLKLLYNFIVDNRTSLESILFATVADNTAVAAALYLEFNFSNVYSNTSNLRYKAFSTVEAALEWIHEIMSQ